MDENISPSARFLWTACENLPFLPMLKCPNGILILMFKTKTGPTATEKGAEIVSKPKSPSVTSAAHICLRRSSFKYLANSQMASPAFYSLLSSSIELWARVRNYMQLNKEWSIVSDLYCKKCNHSLASLSPLSSTPTPSALRNYTSKY